MGGEIGVGVGNGPEKVAADPSSADAARVEAAERTRGETLAQLAKQSATAAAHGDCAAVRAIVGRIRKLDAAFHKSHVEGNAAVARCVK